LEKQQLFEKILSFYKQILMVKHFEATISLKKELNFHN